MVKLALGCLDPAGKIITIEHIFSVSITKWLKCRILVTLAIYLYYVKHKIIALKEKNVNNKRPPSSHVKSDCLRLIQANQRLDAEIS